MILDYREYLIAELTASIAPKQRIVDTDEFQRPIIQAMEYVAETVRSGHVIFLCGNGGSATDALHIAAEFTGRFRHERRPYPVMALVENIASLTAIANDYNYDAIFTRQLAAFAKPDDLLIALSTSGHSKNVIEACIAARHMNMRVIGLTGQLGGQLADVVDVSIKVPSDDTARIQETHITIGHILSGIGEEELLGYHD